MKASNLVTFNSIWCKAITIKDQSACLSNFSYCLSAFPSLLVKTCENGHKLHFLFCLVWSETCAQNSWNCGVNWCCNWKMRLIQGRLVPIRNSLLEHLHWERNFLAIMAWSYYKIFLAGWCLALGILYSCCIPDLCYFISLLYLYEVQFKEVAIFIISSI